MTDKERLENARKVFPNIKVIEIFKKDGINYCKCECPVHGEFEKRYNDYIRSKSGCTKCANDLKKVDKPEKEKKVHKRKKMLSSSDIIESCKKAWGDEYTYEDLEWDEGENIKVKCKIHGQFTTRYYDFIKGHGCPKCSVENRRKAEEEKFKKAMQEINNNEVIFPEDFSYINNYTKVKLIYKGEEFIREPHYFLRNKLLTSADKSEIIEERGIKKSQNRWVDIEEELFNLYGDDLEFKQEQLDFIKSGKAERDYVLDIKCKKHGWKKQNFFELRCGYGCPSCMYKKTSKGEEELLQFIKTIYNGEIISNDRTILSGKELDIYLPEKNIAFEYDGLYWHNNINNYYKYEECKKKNVRLIQITEWEWKFQNEKIKSVISNMFGKYNKRIFARKCVIKEIDNKICKDFCDINHLQNGINSSVNIGLFYNDELVEIVAFSKARYGNYEWELLRECSKLNYKIVGGKSRLMKYFERKYNPGNILSYCDKSKFSGVSYSKEEFELVEESKPNYYYYKNDKRFSRIKFQKHKLKDLLNDFDDKKTEWENMSDNKYMRIFDYGNFVFVKNIDKNK